MNTIAPVNSNQIEHALLIDLDLQDNTGTAYTAHFTTAYKDLTYNSNTYTSLGGFLSISEIADNLTGTEAELSVVLTGLSTDYLEPVLNTQIKGAEITIYRCFFNTATQQLVAGTNVFPRFTGVVTNYSLAEDLNLSQYTASNGIHTITLQCSSIMGVLSKRITGRRTNPADYRIYYTELGSGATGIANDPSMDRILTLHNQAFDFGRPYVGPAVPVNQPNQSTDGSAP